jgi:hypothetical protein
MLTAVGAGDVAGHAAQVLPFEHGGDRRRHAVAGQLPRSAGRVGPLELPQVVAVGLADDQVQACVGLEGVGRIAIDPNPSTTSVPMNLLLQRMIYLRHLEEPSDSAITSQRASDRP